MVAGRLLQPRAALISGGASVRSARLNLAVAAAAIIVVTACGGSTPTGNSSSNGPLTPTQTKGMTLTIEGWGGVWTDTTKKFADHFAQQYGVTIQYPSAPNPGTELHLQEQSGNVQMDVVDTISYTNYKQGDVATFPDWLVNEIKKNVSPDCATNYVVGCYGSTAYVIACNPAVVQKCPTNAKEFWDVQNFPGPRAISGTTPPDAQLLFAELAAGTPQDKLYPIDINAAINKLKEIKPHIQVWPTSGSQMQQVLRDKEVGIEYGWNGRIFVVKNQNIPNLQVSWDDSTVAGGGSAGLAVAKGSPNAQLAFTFLWWWIQQAQLQADWTTALTYPTPNKQVNSLLAPDILAAMPGAPNHAKPVNIDPEFSYQHQADEQRAWQQFITGS
jgi:spermidine/putrescine-binding protein